MSKYINKSHQQGIEKLKSLGIKTISELDSKRNIYKTSRYSFLIELVGEESAIWIMNELSLSEIK